MLILGIDPGSRYTGWGLVRWEGGEQRWVADGRLRVPPKLDLPRRLAVLSREVRSLAESWQPDLAAVESPYFGRGNPRSLIVLAQARGAILAALAAGDLEVREYSPAEVKIAIAGSGRAVKADVARMVRLLLGLSDSGRPADATDALAIALCCARRYRRDRLETV